MKKIDKRYLIILLLLVASISASFTYAYWTSDVTGNTVSNSSTVTIGEGLASKTVVTVTNPESTGTLVPVGKKTYSVNPTTAKESITLEYDVKWASELSNTASGAKGTLSATVKSIKVGTTDTNSIQANLVTSSVVITDSAIVADSATKKVAVTFQLSEPANKAIYDQIATKVITAEIVFTVAVN